MKPILTFLTLFLMLGGVASAEVLTLQKCRQLDETDMGNYEQHYFTIDYKKKKITEVTVYKDAFVTSLNKAIKERPEPVKVYISKINVGTFDIYFSDRNFVKAKKKENFRYAESEAETDIDLKKNIIYQKNYLTHKFKPRQVASNLQYQCILK